MRILSAGLTMLTALVISGNADAKGHYIYPNWYSQPRYYQPVKRVVHRKHHCRCHARLAHRAHVRNPRTGPAHVVRVSVYDRGQIIPNPPGCPPVLFCGCGASIEVFGRSIRDLWLVDNWFRFPRAAPADGMVVLWPHRHIAVIRHYYGNGRALLYDANSGGGLTRVHVVDISNLVVVNPHPEGARHAHWGHSVPL